MTKPEKIVASDAGPALPAAAATSQPVGPAPGAGGPAAAPPLEISSAALLGDRTEVRIRHRGEIYRLTLTRAGKLILHK